jgi:hypothetical protein
VAVTKREQVFVSSTFKDLIEEREAVIKTLLSANCIPAGMEMFPASDDQKFELIKRVIDLCDYYVVIIGGRYGSVDPEKEISYTEMEFDYAVQAKKPVMAFLHGDPGRLPGNKLELDGKLREKLDGFRQKAEQRMVKYWRTGDDLAGQVALALINIRQSHPAEGWIRAGEALTPEVKAELVELRARVRELTVDLDDERRQLASALDPADLDQGDEKVEVECVLRFHWKDTIDAGDAYVSNRERATWVVDPSWNEVLRHLGPDLLDEAPEEDLLESLSALCLRLARRDLVEEEDRAESQEADQGEDKRPVGAVYAAEVFRESFNDVKVQLLALQLIERGLRRRPPSDTNTYWQLTDKGRQQLIRLRASRKKAALDAGPAE